jgi:hypothetical protein
MLTRIGIVYDLKRKKFVRTNPQKYIALNNCIAKLISEPILVTGIPMRRVITISILAISKLGSYNLRLTRYTRTD